MTEIIIPIKDLSQTKQRLSGILKPRDRAGLVLAMLQDLLTAARRVHNGRIWLVANDDVVFDIGRSFDARAIRERRPHGYNQAVVLGFDAVAPGSPVAVLPGDLPLATASEIAALIAPSGRTAAVRIAAARDGRGTNGLFLSEPRLVSPAFGEDSFTSHIRASRAAGVQPALLDAPGLAFDIDTPADLDGFADISPDGATRRVLAELGSGGHHRFLERGAA